MEECLPRALDQQVETWIDENSGLIRLVLTEHLKTFFNTADRRYLPSMDDCTGVVYMATLAAFKGLGTVEGKSSEI